MLMEELWRNGDPGHNIGPQRRFAGMIRKAFLYVTYRLHHELPGVAGNVFIAPGLALAHAEDNAQYHTFAG